MLSKKRFITAIILALISLHFLWSAHDRARTPIRSLGVKHEYATERQLEVDTYRTLSSFCNSLPYCFRPLSGWIVMGVHIILFERILNHKPIKKRRFTAPRENPSSYTPSTSAAGSFVVMSALLLTFILFFLNYPPIIGLLGLSTLTLVPLLNYSKGGMVIYDSLMLLFWPLIIMNFFPIINKLKSNQLILLSGIIGMAASWLMENVGIGYSIALFILAFTKKNHSPASDAPFWKIYFSGSFGTLLALGISWIATHRHPDVYWISPGKGIEATWEIYSKGDKVLDLIKFSGFMINSTLLFALVSFILLLVFKKKIKFDENMEKYRQQIWAGSACILGFMCTSFAGLWMGAGFINEYSRQLLPLGNMMVWFLFSVITFVLTKHGNQLRAKIFKESQT